MKKIIRRGAAAMLAAVTLVTSAAVPVRAAAPRVQVDETMYVNLDYYGTATQINVVKGCTTNGLTEYTDYGTYDKVVNMTDDTAMEPSHGNCRRRIRVFIISVRCRKTASICRGRLTFPINLMEWKRMHPNWRGRLVWLRSM